MCVYKTLSFASFNQVGCLGVNYSTGTFNSFANLYKILLCRKNNRNSNKYVEIYENVLFGRFRNNSTIFENNENTFRMKKNKAFTKLTKQILEQKHTQFMRDYSKYPCDFESTHSTHSVCIQVYQTYLLCCKMALLISLKNLKTLGLITIILCC